MEVVNLDGKNTDIFGDPIPNQTTPETGDEPVDPNNLFADLDRESPTQAINPDDLFNELDEDSPDPLNEVDLNEGSVDSVPNTGSEELNAPEIDTNIYSPNNLRVVPASDSDNEDLSDVENESEKLEVEGEDNEANEFDIDLNDINILNEQVRVTEVEALEEDKIIANEKEQKEDLLNEIMKKYPEKMRNSDFIKNKVLKKIQYNIDLKLNHSIFDADHDVIHHKEKGDNFRPLLQKYKKYNFDNKFLIPIVSEVKKIYNYSETEASNIVNTDFYNEIKNFNKIRDKYTKGIGKKNYSYINENKELSNLINPYNSKEPSKKLDKDTFVVRDCFNEKCNMILNDELIDVKFDSHMLVGRTNRDTNIDQSYLEEEDRIHINGFVMVPVEIINQLDNSIYSLEELTLYFNDFKNLNHYANEYDTYVETINLDIKIGDQVKLCFSEDGHNVNISGVVISIDMNTYSIKPIDDSITSVLEISGDDENVTITKDYNVKNINDGDKLCYNEIKDKIGIYLFPSQDITSLEYTKLLNYILPTNTNIIDSISDNIKDVQNITEVNRIITKYGVHYDDLTNKNSKIIRENLDKNSNKVEVDSNVSLREYNEFLKVKPENRVKQCPKGFIFNRMTQTCENLFVDSRSLSELEEVYGKYPFYNTFIDNSSTRLKWITSHKDHGVLYFKKIMKNKLEFNEKHKMKTLEILRKDIHKADQDLIDIDRNITLIIDRLNSFEGKDRCNEYVLAKKYSSIEDLENDDYKEITFDKDLSQNIGTNIVQLGHYAMLTIKGVNKLYKRIEVDNKHIWSLESSKVLDKILDTQKDFCNQQSKNVSEMDRYFFDSSNNCLTLNGKTCENREITLLRKKKEEKQKILNEKTESLQYLDHSDTYLEDITNQIRNLENFLLNNIRLENMKPKVLEIETTEVDPKYSSIYNKIDQYLEKISKLHDSQKLPHLKYLISKMSRDSEPDENPKNIYCKYGNKVIACRHQEYMIRFYEDEDDSVLQELIDEYGFEVDGTH